MIVGLASAGEGGLTLTGAARTVDVLLRTRTRQTDLAHLFHGRSFEELGS